MEKNKYLNIFFLVIIFLLVITGIIISSTDKTNAPKSVQQDENEASPYEKSYFLSHPVQAETPDFSTISDIKTRKNAFFDYLTPFVNEKNNLTLEDRERITALINSKETLSTQNKEWITILRKHHKLKQLDKYSKADLKALLHRIDVIPASLVLAQAANESAWGTSRFATEGNNFFGQWCFRKGCGLVPESRNADADHEVRKFHDARESVFAYIDNLNSNAAYKKLRTSRAMLREKGKPITGLALVHGLEHYSERGQAYVKEIEGLISYNKLWRFNKSQPNTEAQ
jgi:Bax protein